ncbi:MAG: hypothetical protein JO257_25420 [Deltaproteobacteria bacterium]|nr:hypothetical protein [Deltaproteobacteria bacterium]
MSLSFLPLLVVEEDVPVLARSAIRRAKTAPLELRRVYLMEAAEVLYRDAHLSCADARELLGLEP